MEKFGPFYFVDGEVKVRKFDLDAEIERRGGMDVMVQNMMKHNALLSRMPKPKPKPRPGKPKPKPGC